MSSLRKNFILFIKIIFVLGFSIMILNNLSCKKLDIIRKSKIDTKEVLYITPISASAIVSIIDLSENEAIEYGVCYSYENDIPSINDLITKQTSEIKIGESTIDIQKLKPLSTYYIRSFIKDGEEIIYGKILQFQTSDLELPAIATYDATSITDSSVILNAKLLYTGYDSILEKGFCWSLSTKPTILNSLILNTENTDEFSNPLNSLLPNTTYYVRAFAKNSKGRSYGNEISFKTMVRLAVVITDSVSNILCESAFCSGKLESDGGEQPAQLGFVYSLSPLPTISSQKINVNTTLKEFSANITGLTPTKKYYIRAFVKNSRGIAYGDELSFTTQLPNLPTITTDSILLHDCHSAKIGGFISNDGGAFVNSRGVCWSTNPDPTLSDDKVAIGNSFGQFSIDINSLKPYTTYYFRAFATNYAGTVYGNEIRIQTLGDCWERKQDAPFTGYINVSFSFAVGDYGYVLFDDGFWRYDPQNESWLKLANLPCYADGGYTSFVIGNKAYVGTGFENGFPTRYHQDFWVYDIDSNSWKKLADYGGGKLGGAFGFAVNGKGYVGGGKTTSGYSKEFWEYDPNQNKWTKKANLMQNSYYEKGLESANNGMLISNVADLFIYNVNSNYWSQKKDYPGETGFRAVVFSLKDSIIVGVLDRNKDIYKYKTLLDKWTQLTAFPGNFMDYPFCFMINQKGYVGMGRYRPEIWEYLP
ncbi:MAG: hypothetical protein HN600_02675 [Bacteroidetes bacterium]|nr:hypothetical protein [Bacteroidota bacterium]